MKKSNKFIFWVIGVVSVLIPLVVTLLIFKSDSILELEDNQVLNIRFFPKFHAILNSMTAICLIISLFQIKQKNIKMHQFFNWFAFALSSIFLISYIFYHSVAASVKFGDLNHDSILQESEKLESGFLRYIYYFVLISHIIFAVIIVPLVLYTLLAIYRFGVERHKKIARITWPVWFYVAVTGVLVYFLIEPYY